MRIIGRAVALPQSQRKQTPEIGAVPDGQSKWGILTLQQCGDLGETHSSQVVVMCASMHFHDLARLPSSWCDRMTRTALTGRMPWPGTALKAMTLASASRGSTGWRWGIGALCGPPRTGVAEGVSPTDAYGVLPPHGGRELACRLPHSSSCHFNTESPVIS
jgi:hypothetical protein